MTRADAVACFASFLLGAVPSMLSSCSPPQPGTTFTELPSVSKPEKTDPVVKYYPPVEGTYNSDGTVTFKTDAVGGWSVAVVNDDDETTDSDAHSQGGPVTVTPDEETDHFLIDWDMALYNKEVDIDDFLSEEDD